MAFVESFDALFECQQSKVDVHCFSHVISQDVTVVGAH
jgi:hypothetical protein